MWKDDASPGLQLVRLLSFQVATCESRNVTDSGSIEQIT